MEEMFRKASENDYNHRGIFQIGKKYKRVRSINLVRTKVRCGRRELSRILYGVERKQSIFYCLHFPVM